jgi:ankyrin repeat protein
VKKRLPSRANLEQLKNQAKAILRAHRAASPDVLKLIQEHHPQWRRSSEAAIQAARLTLSDTQLVVASQYGFETWARLKSHIQLRQATLQTEGSVNMLREAAGRGDLVLLNKLLDADPELVNEPGGPGVRTALHQAVFGKQQAAVSLLLERGADPNIRCEGDNATPLHFAAEKQLFPIIRLLVEHGADPIGEGDYHELGVIGWATAWDYMDANREVVDYLLAHGARHNIFSAVAMGEVEVIRKLVSRSPADLERRMDLANKRRMPLHLAVVKKQTESLKALLDLGANTESLDEAGFTALDEAGLRGEAAMAQILLDRGAKVRLPAAIALQRTRDADRLLRRDPEILKPGNRWGNLIVRASELAPGHVIEALISAGASVAARDDPKTSVDSTWGYTPLHAAAFHGNLSAAAVLLKHGANATVRDERYHGTPAGWANYAGHTDVRDLILQGPVDIMEAIEYGLTERILAILEGDPDALNRPFSAYSLNPLYAEGWYTPVAFAVIRERIETVRLLLAHDADTTVRAPDGRSLYEIAQQKGHGDIAALLKSRNAHS